VNYREKAQAKGCTCFWDRTPDTVYYFDRCCPVGPTHQGWPYGEGVQLQLWPAPTWWDLMFSSKSELVDG
jgi:hypothetical protein